MPEPQKINLIHKLAPGDTVVLTALVRDIALTYPGRFQIGVETNGSAMWENNPYITPLKGQKNVRQLKIHYGAGLREQNYETIHFLAYDHRNFEKQTGVKVPLTLPYPDLHLSEEEKTVPLVEGRYWLFLSGGKSDFTAKVWDYRYWQQTVDILRGQGLRFVQTGATNKGHWHPEINGALNIVGKDDLRRLLRLVYHADGIICAVTCAMHCAAAFQKPCVVIAGGREAWYWEAYVPENRGLGGPDIARKITMPHRYLHTIGQLDCCKSHGCWRSKVLPINNDKSICKYPVIRPQQSIPLCLDMITPAMVSQAVLSYYYDGSIKPPPGTQVAEDVEKMFEMPVHKTDPLISP